MGLLNLIDKFIIKFGDKQSALDLEKNTQKIIIKNIGETIFLKQTHSSDGIILENNIDSFAKEGDFIFTKIIGLAIGVFTADCLSIIIIDPIAQNCAVIHAGWRGSLDNIILNIIKIFLVHNSILKDLMFYFGPSIGSCCYEVTAEFITKISNQELISYKNNKIYFDILNYNIMLLLDYGIKYNQINLDNWKCTFCNIEFCSYRKDKKSNLRQYSIVKIIQ